MEIEKDELLLAVRGVVGGIHIDGDRHNAVCSRSESSQSPGPLVCLTFDGI